MTTREPYPVTDSRNGLVKWWLDVVDATDVTEEVLDAARNIVDGWYDDSPIDWENVWDRMDGQSFDSWPESDGRGWLHICMGAEDSSPAMRKIQRTIRAERKAS